MLMGYISHNNNSPRHLPQIAESKLFTTGSDGKIRLQIVHQLIQYFPLLLCYGNTCGVIDNGNSIMTNIHNLIFSKYMEGD